MLVSISPRFPPIFPPKSTLLLLLFFSLIFFQNIAIMYCTNTNTQISRHRRGRRTTQTETNTTNPCPNPTEYSYNPSTESCFYVSHTILPYTTQKAFCHNRRNSLPPQFEVALADIPNTETNALVCKLIRKGTTTNVKRQSTSTEDTLYHFGLKRVDMVWKWIRTGDPMTFTSWEPNKPKAEVADHILAMFKPSDCMWKVRWSYKTGGAICEIWNMNPCRHNNGGCDEIQFSYCVKTGPGLRDCVCPDGFKLYDGKCIDVNECGKNKDACLPKSCVNLKGSYECSVCNANFELLEPGESTRSRSRVDEHKPQQQQQQKQQEEEQPHACVDINECERDLHNCTPAIEFTCVNMEGGFKCVEKVFTDSNSFRVVLTVVIVVLVLGLVGVLYLLFNYRLQAQILEEQRNTRHSVMNYRHSARESRRSARLQKRKSETMTNSNDENGNVGVRSVNSDSALSANAKATGPLRDQYRNRLSAIGKKSTMVL